VTGTQEPAFYFGERGGYQYGGGYHPPPQQARQQCIALINRLLVLAADLELAGPVSSTYSSA